MCTAITLKNKDFYFGRTLDLEYSYNENVTVTPRKYPFHFRQVEDIKEHYAIIGMATIEKGYPLYCDAVNEKGLAMGGLAFRRSAKYNPICADRDNIAVFEMIPWILSQCSSVGEAEKLIDKINITNTVFSPELGTAPLHWMIADSKGAITVEPLANGVKVYDNPVGVLTNEPDFGFQINNLNSYLNLTPYEPDCRFAEGIALDRYSRGMGAIGLPGDLSSPSRFVRAAFTKSNSVSGESEEENVSQFFHIMDTVSHPRGCVRLGDKGDEKYEITVYTSCCNTDKGIYYYKTYEDCRIHAVDMYRENIDSSELISYPVSRKTEITRVN